MAKTVVGLFESLEQAQYVIEELTNNGFLRSHISLVANNARSPQGSEEVMRTTDVNGNRTTNAYTGSQEEAEAAGKGAVAGTVAGGVLGALAGFALLTVPGLGPIVAAGPLLTMFGTSAAGAGIGAAIGGLLGALTAAGVPEAEAQLYVEGVRQGGALVMLNADDNLAQRAYDIMQRNGAADLHETGAAIQRDIMAETRSKNNPNLTGGESIPPAQTNEMQ